MNDHSNVHGWLAFSVGSGIVGSIDWFVHVSIPYLQFAALALSVGAGVKAWIAAHRKGKK